MDFFIIIILILFNGFFAMVEIAVVSARKSNLKNMAAAGDQKSQVALDLAEKPNIFLSSVQIGITLVTVLAGAVGDGRLVSRLSSFLEPLPLIGLLHEHLAFIMIMSLVTYLSIVIGELVPKRIALSNPEKIASVSAPLMAFISRLASPVIRVLSVSTELVFKLIGLKPASSPKITEEEVRILIREGTDMGIFSRTEKKLIERALRLDDLRVGLLMTPKHKMSVFNMGRFLRQPRQHLAGYRHSRIIFTEGKKEKILGVVHTKDLLSLFMENGKLEANKLKDIVVKPHLVPESIKAIKVLEMFRRSPVHIALVLDEFGTIQGMVTLNDILEALVGEIKTQVVHDRLIATRKDGSLLVDGTVSIYELQKRLRLQGLTTKDMDMYQTVAGLVIAHLEKIPKTGDAFEKLGYVFEVVDMDNNRIDKILIKKVKI